MNAETKMLILITGASSHVGAALVRFVAEQGHTPVIHYFEDEAGARAVLKDAQQHTNNATMIQADLTTSAGVATTLDHIGATHHRLDAVIHTVGDFLFAPLLQTQEKGFHRVIDTNLTSSLLLAQAAVPLMREQGRGRIIFFGAAHADRATARPHTTAYMMAKSAVHALTQQLALELATQQITVSCIAPNVLEESNYPLHTPTEQAVSYAAVNTTLQYLLDAPHEAVNGTILTLSDGWLPRS